MRRDTPSLSRGAPNAYVPPSRRPPSSTPAATGPPADPAIISSQLARSPLESSQAAIDEKVPNPAEIAVSIEDTSLPSQPDSGIITTAVEPTIGSMNPEIKPGTGSSGPFQDVYESFKAFTSAEKLRLQQHQRAVQQQRSSNARQEKSVKLNDLKKFSQNFKLHSRVPEDLVPILAKTKEKQDEIRDKAEQHAKNKEQKEKDKVASPTLTGSQTEQKPQAVTPASVAGQGAEAVSQASHRQRSNQHIKTQNVNMPLPRGPGMFNQRLVQNQAQFRAGQLGNVPPPLPIQTTRPPPLSPNNAAESGLTSPTSTLSSRFNVNAKAFEFKPNPAASMFTPGPSGTDSKRPSVSVSTRGTTPKPGKFFSANKKPKPSEDETTAKGSSSAVARMAEGIDEQKKAQFAANGSIPQAYRTPPVWEPSAGNLDKTYVEFFPKASGHPSVSPMPAQPNGAMPHQHQLPPHLQNGMQSNQQTPRFYAAQPQHMQHMHMEDGRMHYASSNSSVQPSPRMANPAMAYNGQMHPQMPNYAYGMSGTGMSPMHMRPMPAGGQFMGPQGSPMGGHMMVQQASNGPYMNGPMPQQMSMYPSPVPNQVQPHYAGHPSQHGMPGGYAGSPRGYPMTHQGSQQGHGPQGTFMATGPQGPLMMPQHAGQSKMLPYNSLSFTIANTTRPVVPTRSYGQTQYQGQHPHHPYAMQHRAMSGNGYNQHTPRQQHAMPQHGQMSGAMVPTLSSNGEEPR